MSCNLLMITVFLSVALPFTQFGYAESPSPVPSVDIFVSVDRSDLAEAKMLIMAKDGTAFETLQALVNAIPQIDESRVSLTVVPASKQLLAPTANGNRHLGIRLSVEPIEAFVTDNMPYAVTSGLYQTLTNSNSSKPVVVKSTQGFAKRLQEEQDTNAGGDPFGG
ncbi:hypothetical protein FYK55_17140 [Roseiconus nitratireducens]|uniref:Uncharacterized protein n=1 Tax=Roseiconus nitratireducens TaxID=2605748 RepID=A0A5M6D361_9BACT|nr:hypothetical protein [Roseiconus nitratireducens]KAA5541921.1 hypothetical protein FYK55_17140 [Roseiconus nitratireducens]